MTADVKKPDSEESSRMWASASFVGVLIVIGLPLWWKTTEVYRVALPYEEINSFKPLSHSIHTELVIHAYDQKTADVVATQVEKAFHDIDVIKLHITKSLLAPPLQHALDSVADEAEVVEILSSTLDLGDQNKFHVVQRRPLRTDTWLGSERVLLFRDEKASFTVSWCLSRWVLQPHILVGARASSADAWRRVRCAPSAAYSALLSVVHPEPEMQVLFDARRGMEDYVGTFVDELSALHNFTLKSQWLHLLDFDFHAKELRSPFRHWSVQQSHLSQLLTAIEERSASRVSQETTLSLVLYVVPCRIAPLVIYDQYDMMNQSPIQAFISPKWGGVILASPSHDECNRTSVIFEPDVRRIMGTFVAQLRTLLGIVDAEQIPNAYIEPLRSVVPRKWEVDSLTRIRMLEQLTSAERTLQSLAKLLGEIPNIVIDDSVGRSIRHSVSDIRSSVTSSLAGNVTAAAEASLRAMTRADDAFNAPRLLALLYFPDDQKYAIYIPLFLPIMFPVVLSLKNLFLWFRGKPIHKKEKTD